MAWHRVAAKTREYWRVKINGIMAVARNAQRLRSVARRNAA